MNNTENASPNELEHAGQLLAELALLRREGGYCDVFLQAECDVSAAGEVPSEVRGVRAHSALLAAASSFFHQLFKISYKNCLLPIIIVKDVDLETLEALVENIYSPEPLVMSVDNAKALLLAASMLDVGDVRDAACVCLTQALAADNVLGVRATAELSACATLSAAATKYIDDHFEQVLQADEVLSLGLSALTALLDRDRLAAIEEHVFDVVLRWIQYRPQERRCHLMFLLRDVRLRLVPRGILAQRARAEPLARERLALLQIAEALAPSNPRLEALAPTAATVQPVELHQDAETLASDYMRSQRRTAVTVPQAKLLQASKTLAVYQSEHRAPTDITVQPMELLQDAEMLPIDHMRSERQVSTAAPVQQAELLQASEALAVDQSKRRGPTDITVQPTELLQDAETLAADHVRPERCMTFTTGTRPAKLLEVTEPDRCCRCVQSNSQMQKSSAALLVIGGYMKDGHSDSVIVCPLERYWLWRTATLPTPRSGAGATLLDGRVYLVGGCDNWPPKDTTYVYEVATDSWSSGPRMTAGRHVLAAASLAGRVYAVGGWNDCHPVDLTEALDPREGVWRPVASIATARGTHDVATVRGRLYAVGGSNCKEDLNSVERYDPVADKWEVVESMAERRDGVAVGVVDDAMYAVGGGRGSTVLRSVERYCECSGWQTAPPLAEGLSRAAVATGGGLLYVVGGFGKEVMPLRTVSVLNPATAQWSELPNLPGGRARPDAFVIPWTPKPLHY